MPRVPQTLAAALCFAGPATADPPSPPAGSEAVDPPAGTSSVLEAPQTTGAREGFALGVALARQGQWAEALAAFERSARLRSHPATTFNVGYCERALGRYTRARKYLLLALQEHDGHLNGHLEQDLIDQSRAYVAEIDRRVARAVTSLPDPSTAVAVDGRPLEIVSSSPLVLSAGTRDPGPPEVPPAQEFVLLIDPGDHVLVLKRGEGPEKLSNLRLTSGETRELRFAAPVAPVAQAVRAPRPVSADPPDRTPAYVAWVVGGVGLVVGASTGFLALRSAGELERKCGGHTCPPGEESQVNDLSTLTLLANVGFGVAGAGAVTGLVLYLVAGSTPRPRVRAASVRPVGASIGGRF